MSNQLKRRIDGACVLARGAGVILNSLAGCQSQELHRRLFDEADELQEISRRLDPLLSRLTERTKAKPPVAP